MNANEFIATWLESHTRQLTLSQGGFDWHAVRAGMSLVTSTVAHEALIHCYSSDLSNDESVFLRFIGITPISEASLQMEDIQNFSLLQLKSMLRERRMSTNGNKTQLTERLLAAPSGRTNIVLHLIKKWFMKPITNTFMKVGSLNERNIIAALPQFLEKNDSGFTLDSGIEQKGLLQRKHVGTETELDFLATSVDGCAVFNFNQNENIQRIVTAIEFKTATNSSSQAEASERLLRARVLEGNPNRLVFRCSLHTDLFKLLVWTPAYRAQVLHHCTTISTNVCLFVVAGRVKIIYAVFVKISEADRNMYAQIVKNACLESLRLFSRTPAIFFTEPEHFGHAVDVETIILWQKIAESVINSDPLRGPAHDIIPYCVSLWNQGKGGQDVCSRILKNLKVDFQRLTPRAFIFIRFIMTALMNAHMLHRILQFEARIDDFNSYKSLKAALNRQKSFFQFIAGFSRSWAPSLRFINVATDALSISVAVEENNDALIVPEELPRPSKRNIFSWLQSDNGKKLRLSSAPHMRSSRTQRHCPLCKRQTTAFCQTCELNFCTSLGQGHRKTCWELVHTADRLRGREVTSQSGVIGRIGRQNQQNT